MKKNKYIEFNGYIEIPFTDTFDETDFNEFVKKYDIRGITYNELIQIGEGKLEDRPIQLGKNLFDGDGYPRYAYDFFLTLVQSELVTKWSKVDMDADVFIEESEIFPKD
jgi:hypothetical protein